MTAFRQMLKDPKVLELLATSGTLYSWGKGDPSTPWPAEAYDCSGFAQGALVQLGLLSRKQPDRGAAALANCSERVEDEPRLGDLAFYGKPVSHVMVCLGNGWVIGATGGGSHTHADDAEACVQPRRLRYRKDLLVVGRLRPEFAKD